MTQQVMTFGLFPFSLSDSGTTVVTTLIDTAKKLIVCANLGDSRCVLSSDGVVRCSLSIGEIISINRVSSNQAIPMSHDHKPTDEKEMARIIAAGGTVEAGRCLLLLLALC